MSEHEQGERHGWFLAAAGAIGDLDHPFYDEERQRDVWNEASAVGLQVVLLLGMVAATAMVWLGGTSAVPYAVAVLAVGVVAAAVSLAYARRLGVDVTADAAGVLRLRLVPYGVLWVLLLVGALRGAPADGFTGGFARGAVLGSAVAVLALVLSGLRARRAARG